MTLRIHSPKAVIIHVVTGFLGVGKSTLIQGLIKQRPTRERWGVLVNEFGEVGVDGALFANQGVAVKEVPGGCICCAAGVPMRVALTQLLRDQTLDRLFVEPTGLGHAREILDQLSSQEFASRIALGATLTLVEPNKLAQAKYREHPVYASQLSVADLLILTKTEDATPDALGFVDTFAKSLPNKPTVITSRWGDLPFAVIEQADIHTKRAQRSSGARYGLGLSIDKDGVPAVDDAPLPRNGYREKVKVTREFTTIGWQCGAEVRFDEQLLFDWLLTSAPMRAKAVVRTINGTTVLNAVDGRITSAQGSEANIEDSRIELIFANQPNDPQGQVILDMAQNFIKCVTAPSFLQKVE